MKPRHLSKFNLGPILAGLTVSLLILTVGLAHAQTTNYWDGGTIDILTSGDGVSQGGTGTWDTTILNWDPGAAPHVPWVNANNDTAVFGGTAGTVTLGADTTVGGLIFRDIAGYLISGGTLTFGVAGSIVANTNATISSVLAGSVAIAKTGAGTLTLSGTNTFSGALSVPSGTLAIATINNVSANGTLGNSAFPVVLGDIGATGTVQYTGGTATSTKPFTMATGGTGVFDVTIAANTLTLGGVIDGGGGLTKTGPGTLTLTTAANTYGGGAMVNQGTLRFNVTGAIGGSGRSVTVTNGATVAAGYAIDNAFLNRLVENTNAFNVNVAATSVNPLDFRSSAGANLPNVTLTGAGGLIYGGILTPNSTTFRLGNSDTTVAFANGRLFTVSNVLSGAGNSVVISGGNPVYLTAANTFGGTVTVNPGAAVGFTTAILDGMGGGPGVRSILVGDGASLLRTGGSLNNALLQRLVETTNAFTIYANNAGSGNALDFSGTNGGANLPNVSLATWDNAGTRSFTFTGTITPGNNTYRFGGSRAANFINLPNANTLTGARSLVVGGQSAVKVRVYNANNFSGETLVNAGTLYAFTNLAFQNSTINTAGGGFLDVSGDRQGLTPSVNTPVPNPILGGLKGSKDLVAVFNASYTNVTALTLNPGVGVINSYSGVITNGAPTGTRLTKTGAGTQILAGANTYTGATTVSNGTLLVNGALAAASAVTVNAGATLGGTGLIGGNVTVADGGNLAPGASAGTLSIGGNLDLSAQAAGGTGKLTFELGALANPRDKIAVTGSLIIGTDVLGFSDFVFTNLDEVEAGTYKLITSGDLSGTLDPADIGGTIGVFTATLQINGNDLELVVSSGSPLVFSRFGPLSGTSFPLTFSGPNGQSYQVLTSTNLALPLSNWTVVTIGTFGASPVTYTNTSATSAQRFYCLIPLARTTVFSDDLESGIGAWSLGSEGAPGTAWELGAPRNVGPTTAHSPTNCFGSNLAGNYDIDANIWLRSPVIDLRAIGSATLEFWHFTSIWTGGNDFGSVSVLDASDESVLAVLVPSVDGDTASWVRVRRTLPAAALGRQIKLEFRFQSVLGGKAGWYLDDVRIVTP